VLICVIRRSLNGLISFSLVYLRFLSIFQNNREIFIISRRMSGIPRLGFVVVQGSNGLSSQGDQICIIQILWLLWLSKVPAKLVRFFVAKLDLGGPEWPSARVDLPELVPPPDYDNASCMSTDRDDLAGDVTNAVDDLLKDPDADDVLLLYFNHGDRDFLGPDALAFDVGTLASLAQLALAIPNKRILFVFSACESTTLAEQVWTRLVQQAATDEEKRKLAASVGFLAAGMTPTLTSAILLSNDERLVYPIPSKAPQVDFALGFRIHNPMFGRQLIWLWAYGLAAGSTELLRNFPSWLNSESDFIGTGVDGTFCNGFQAGFVGSSPGDGLADAANGQSESERLGDLPIEHFFPLGPHDSTKLLRAFDVPKVVDLQGVPDLANQKLGQVIPNVKIGEQVDDMRCFWKPGFTCYNFRGIFLHIELVDDKVVVQKQGRMGELPLTDPIRAHLTDPSFLNGGGPAEGHSSSERVAWGDFALRFEELAKEQGWFGKPEVVSDECYYAAKKFLESLNGPVPRSPFMYEFADYSRHCKLEDFERIVTAMFKEMSGTPAP
jgi:hypothetical protein